MKKHFLLPDTTNRRGQERRRMKAKAGILILLAGLLAQPAFCQRACDTLYMTNGAEILIEIVHTYTHGIVYTKCEENKGFEYYTIRDEIVKIRYQNPEIRSTKILQEKKMPKQEIELNRPRFLFWVGYDLISSVGYGNYTQVFPIQFGIEMHVPDQPIRLGLNFQPYFFRGNQQADGTGLEIGLVAKKTSIGRLSGLVKAGYWGMDVRIGRHPHILEYNLNEKVEYSWLKIMPCIGLQYVRGPFAIDFRLPIGVEFLSATDSNSTENWNDFATEPTLSVGLRF